MPAFVSTLCICIVFVPMFFLTGVARYLFVPLAEAVVFAMLASYLLVAHAGADAGDVPAARARAARHRRGATPQSVRAARSARFDRGFERMRDGYRGAARSLRRRPARLSALVFLAFCVAVAAAVPAGSARTSSRRSTAASSGCTARADRHAHRGDGAPLPTTSRRCIRELIPPTSSPAIIDNIGLPYSAASTCRTATSAPIGPADADIMVSLSQGHRPTDDYIHDLRMTLPKRFPGVTFSFLPADIVTQILNFGLPAPIDIQIVGAQHRRAIASSPASWCTKLAQVPGIADLRVQQAFNQPRAASRRRPHARRAARPDAARRRQQPADLAVAAAPRRRRRSG